jgi:hypothetical protein
MHVCVFVYESVYAMKNTRGVCIHEQTSGYICDDDRVYVYKHNISSLTYMAHPFAVVTSLPL